MFAAQRLAKLRIKSTQARREQIVQSPFIPTTVRVRNIQEAEMAIKDVGVYQQSGGVVLVQVQW